MFVGWGGIFIFVCWGEGVYFLLLFFLNFIFFLFVWSVGFFMYHANMKVVIVEEKNTEPDDAGYVIFFSAINASF